MFKFKVGEVVTIREDLELGEIDLTECDEYNENYESVVEPMLTYKGKLAMITDIDEEGEYVLDIDGGHWCWTHQMFAEGMNL